MQRFYFNVRAEQCIIDDEGDMLPGLSEAVLEAAHIARDHVRAELHRGLPLSLDGSVDVLSAPGDVLATVSFADALGQNLQVGALGDDG